jgi:hypothetical protein
MQVEGGVITLDQPWKMPGNNKVVARLHCRLTSAAEPQRFPAAGSRGANAGRDRRQRVCIGWPHVIRCPSGVRRPNSLSPHGLSAGLDVISAPRAVTSS